MSHISHLILKKHIFKNRKTKNYYRPIKFKVGTAGLFSLCRQQFELLYWKGIRRFLRRKALKSRHKFFKKKIWLFLTPNIIFSGKSVNSRMGSGVGKLVRVAIQLLSYKTFMEFRYVSPFWLAKLMTRVRYRYPLKFLPFYRKKGLWHENYYRATK